MGLENATDGRRRWWWGSTLLGNWRGMVNGINTPTLRNRCQRVKDRWSELQDSGMRELGCRAKAHVCNAGPRKCRLKQRS